MNDGHIREFNATEAAAERRAGTDEQRERFVEDWIDRAMKNIEYVEEPLSGEFKWIAIARIYEAVKGGNSHTIGYLFLEELRKYWTPMAEKAMAEHDFTGDV